MPMRYLMAGLLVTAALLSGCAARGSRPSREGGPRTVLEVDNQSFHDMTIYVISGGGQRIRLGTATGLRRTELTIPSIVLGGARQVAFIADPLGSTRTTLTQEIWVTAGDHVTMLIPP